MRSTPWRVEAALAVLFAVYLADRWTASRTGL
jgi:hypothetical protein